MTAKTEAHMLAALEAHLKAFRVLEEHIPNVRPLAGAFINQAEHHIKAARASLPADVAVMQEVAAREPAASPSNPLAQSGGREATAEEAMAAGEPTAAEEPPNGG